MDKRYSSMKSTESAGAGAKESQAFIDKADELINFFLNITIPEVDIDQYKISMGVSAEEYATKKANDFKSSFFSSPSQSGSQTHSADAGNGHKQPSSEELSDASNPRSGAGQI